MTTLRLTLTMAFFLPGALSCVDNDTMVDENFGHMGITSCAAGAGAGGCDMFPDVMNVSCPLSCAAGCGAPYCFDNDAMVDENFGHVGITSCAVGAGAGGCDMFPDVMNVSCPLSCAVGCGTPCVDNDALVAENYGHMGITSCAAGAGAGGCDMFPEVMASLSALMRLGADCAKSLTVLHQIMH
eukprot:SAG11_NODE_195_length_12838_cov_15.711045_7_plen_184_part_00